MIHKLLEIKNLPVILLLALASAISSLMIVYRVMHSGHSIYLFLIWNMFLAWIPLGFATYAAKSKSKLIATGAFMAWLLFFPNSHYILTDIFHLRVRPGIPLWYDLLVLLLSSWIGAMLGFLSLIEIHGLLRRYLSRFVTWLGIVVILGLESFGIYLGRFLRFNSWDVVTDPFTLFNYLAEVLTHPMHNKGIYKFSICFTVFLLLSYVFIFVLIKPKFDTVQRLKA